MMALRGMKFSVPCVHSYLATAGYVYTVRGYKLQECKVYVDDIGPCYRQPVMAVDNKGQLGAYAPFSGFNNVDDWWKQIRRFVRDDRQLWLYKVEKAEGGHEE